MKKTALIHAAVALILVLLSIGAYLWWFSHARTLASQARSLASQIEAKQADHSGGAAVRDLRAQVEAREAFVEGAFVREDDIVSFLEELESVGAGQGVDVGVVSVSDAQGGRIEIALALRGAFAPLMRTIGLIEHGPYAGATKTLTVEAQEGGVWSAAYTLIVATP